MRGNVYSITLIRFETERIIKDIFTHPDYSIEDFERAIKEELWFMFGINVHLIVVCPSNFNKNNYIVKLRTWGYDIEYYLAEINIENKEVKKF